MYNRNTVVSGDSTASGAANPTPPTPSYINHYSSLLTPGSSGAMSNLTTTSASASNMNTPQYQQHYQRQYAAATAAVDNDDDQSQGSVTGYSANGRGGSKGCGHAWCSCTQLWVQAREQCLLPVSEIFLTSSWWRALLVAGNVLLLFGNPIQVLILPKVLDPAMDVLYTLVLVAFLVDMVFRAAAVPGYFGIYRDYHSVDYHYHHHHNSNSNNQNNNSSCCNYKGGCLGFGCWPHMGSFLFWCDLFSTLTLLWDISFTNPTNFQLIQKTINIDEKLMLLQGSIIDINSDHPWELDFALMVTILKTARVVRFVRSQAVSNVIAKVNWYWPVQRMNALCYYLRCCSVRRRGYDEEGAEDDDAPNGGGGGPSNPNQGGGGGGGVDMSSHSDHRKKNTGAAANSLEDPIRRQTWGGLGLSTLAAVKAQRLAREAELQETKTFAGRIRIQLRKMGLVAKDHTEWKRQLAATKIQRAWRKAVARHQHFLNSDHFMDELDRLGPVQEEEDYENGATGGNHHGHNGRHHLSNSLTKSSHHRKSGNSVSKKRLPRSIRKMSIYPGMDAAAAATARISQKLKYATSGDNAAESQVGGAMRELTGQRVAIGILVALLLTAFFTYVEEDATRPATMAILHSQITGTSLSPTGPVTTPPPLRWKKMALDAARNSSVKDLYRFEEIDVNGIATWVDFPNQQAVEEIEDDLRKREKLQIVIESLNYSDPENRTMTSVGYFAYRQERINQALVQLFATLFILLLWLFGVTAFAGPVMVLVVLPIERMVRLLGMLMVDPLGYQSTSRYRRFVAEEDELTKNTRWTKEVLKGMETSFLMSTILRIGSLMKVGFGSAGVEIIRKNLEKKQGGDVNLQTSKGVTVSCIFLFCDIRQFTDATECLQEEVFVFTNRIAAVVHSHCHSFGGSANKNVGDAFLCSWLLDDPPPGEESGFGGSDDRLYAKHNQADKCLMCVVKIIMALHHDSYYIETMSEAPRQRLLAKLKKRPGPVVQMGCGLHAGKAVQGAIGSERKIDATYVSEAVEMSEFLESSTKKYGLKMLMSNSFYNLMHSNNRQRCRLVDQIVMPTEDEDEDDGMGMMYERDDIVELYTFDMDIDALWTVPTQNQKSTAKDVMDGGSMSDGADSRQGVSDRRVEHKDRRGELKKVASGAQRTPGSTRIRKGRRMSLSVMRGNKTDLNSSSANASLVGPKNMDSSAHEGFLGGGANIDPNHSSAAMKEEAPPEFRKPELVLPTGPALYTPAIWRTETMFRIRKKYLDGLFFHNYSQGLQSFYHREWDRATQSFKAILDTFEDGPSRYFLKQIEKNGGKPPPNFRPYGIA